MRAVERGGAHADPREMRRQVEPAPLARHLARQCLLVVQQQRFVGRVEVDALEAVDRLARERFHEAQRVADAFDHRAVFVLQRRMLDPGEIPVFRVMQIGEAAIDQRADEVHRHRRVRVALDQALRIGTARFGRERGCVDEVAAIARQA